MLPQVGHVVPFLTYGQVSQSPAIFEAGLIKLKMEIVNLASVPDLPVSGCRVVESVNVADVFGSQDSWIPEVFIAAPTTFATAQSTYGSHASAGVDWLRAVTGTMLSKSSGYKPHVYPVTAMNRGVEA